MQMLMRNSAKSIENFEDEENRRWMHLGNRNIRVEHRDHKLYISCIFCLIRIFSGRNVSNARLVSKAIRL